MQRLQTRVQFQAVLSGGAVVRTAHFALHRVTLDTPPQGRELPTSCTGLFGVREVWIGALVPKRWAKQAVTRNAVKRQIYSVSASFESVLPLSAYVVRLRSVFDRQQFISASSDALKRAIREELHQLFERAAGHTAVAYSRTGVS